MGPTGDVDQENSSSRTNHDHLEAIATKRSCVEQPIRCGTTRAEWDSLLLEVHSYRRRLQRLPVVRDRERCNSCQLFQDDLRGSIANNATGLQHRVLQVPCDQSRDAGRSDCQC